MSRIVFNKLLLHSFENYQVLFNELKYHNHNAHHLASLYLLDVDDDKLQRTYTTMCEDLDPYETSPYEINLSNWRTYLGNRNCCKSYRDFFHEQLTTAGDDWHKRFKEILLDDQVCPLINDVFGGLAHPLIHIGYALELDSQIIAIEALTLAAISYNYLHEIVDKLEPPRSPSKTALEIFKAIHLDNRLPVYDRPNIEGLEKLIENYTDIVLCHYNQWNINKGTIEKTIEELFDLAVYIYGATHKSNQIEFDFVLVHLLTSMHAIRMIYLHMDNLLVCERILFQFFYFALMIYVCQLRPEINESLIHDYEVKNNWDYVLNRLLNTKLIDDAHLVKVIRSLKEAENIYGSKNQFYLKTAIKTVDNLNVNSPWIGRSDDERQLNVVKLS